MLQAYFLGSVFHSHYYHNTLVPAYENPKEKDY